MNRKNTEQQRYANDDYSRYAGPDYEKHRLSDHLSQPGVSGKDRDEGSWFNESQYQTQKNFMGKGPKGYRRQDAYIHEEVCAALEQDPYVDASDIEVEVKEGIVTLRGTVQTRATKREAESCIENLQGVEDVYNLLTLKPSQNLATSID